uniref:Uncharacterized protein n=1 Tax=Grammatophora oceanica TaxID=210454 RepID=A0A7S1UU02_9STRA
MCRPRILFRLPLYNGSIPDSLLRACCDVYCSNASLSTFGPSWGPSHDSDPTITSSNIRFEEARSSILATVSFHRSMKGLSPETGKSISTLPASVVVLLNGSS